MSLIEILIALIILSVAILALLGVLGRGLMSVKKGKNVAIASNLAISQFEVYKDNFHMIPFYPGVASGSYYYPDRSNSGDDYQKGKFVHHTVDADDLPADTYYGGISCFSGSHSFYTRVPDYDLNHDGIANDIIEPLEPLDNEGTIFTPVVEIKAWNNGFDINEIKHINVTVYWRERNEEGVQASLKHVTFEGYIVRTQADPW